MAVATDAPPKTKTKESEEVESGGGDARENGWENP